MRNSVVRAALSTFAIALSACMLFATSAEAASAYRVVSLTSNVSGQAPWTDPNLVNAWGLAFFPGSPFWVSDEVTGVSTLYDNQGVPQSLVVTIPAAPEQPMGTTGSPTGIVANGTNAFVVSGNGASGPGIFLFATLDGTISGWNPGVDPLHAVIAVDNFKSHALYTGLALVKTQHGPRLYAADAANDRVECFDPKFRPLFSFTDPHVPQGLSVYGVHLVMGRIVVTFASLSPHAGGVVDMFDFGGRLVKTLASNGPHGPLDAPWGVTGASPNFGQFSNDILVSNLDSGRINAYDPNTGAFMGQLKDARGRTISIPGLWSIDFGVGGGKNGHPNELFFTAGPNDYADGLFGKIVVAGQ